MTKNILLIEDDEVKRQSILGVLGKRQGLEIILANSVKSAIDAIRRSSFDLIVADMSLPTFDIESRERGGTPRPFGGVEVFEFLDRKEIDVPVVVVTSYSAISDGKRSMTISDWEATLKVDFPANFSGIVYFDFAYADWEDSFSTAIAPILDKENS